jgi:hypothetical protein
MARGRLSVRVVIPWLFSISSTGSLIGGLPLIAPTPSEGFGEREADLSIRTRRDGRELARIMNDPG